MAKAKQFTSSRDGLFVRAYSGDGSVLLAFDLENAPDERFAGFAIRLTPPKGKAYFIPNRLNFKSGLTAASTSKDRVWTPSDEAPFQKFRWVNVPPNGEGGYRYSVIPMFHKTGGGLDRGTACDVDVEIGTEMADGLENFEVGFTRGYIGSQAYASQFKNAPIRPPKKTVSFDTSKFEKQWKWLGFHARGMLFEFMGEALKDKKTTVDLFAYDLDEPAFIAALQKLGPRLRAFLDDAPLHKAKEGKEAPIEVKARALLEKSAGKQNVKAGHFSRFAHNKVLILKRNGVPVKVLTGSANFSIRGLYVQANNVIVIRDPDVTSLYAKAFDQAFDHPLKDFNDSEIASGWFEAEGEGLPRFDVSFSPHTEAEVSLDKVAEAIRNAQSSVLFAVMAMGGGGEVLEQLRNLGSRQELFTYGMSQSKAGLSLFKPGAANAVTASVAFLQSKVPAPFQKEFSGGSGQTIHHKFVVVDFNDQSPVVFTGSSNLAAGGEKSNGDNLLAIFDPAIVSEYAVEAVRLVDHYHFRVALKETGEKPITLKLRSGGGAPWWKPYYTEGTAKFNDRTLFARPIAKGASG